MAKKPEITPIDTSFNVVGTLNQNFENIREAFGNTLSLDGSTPNAMRSDLDMNSHDVLNAASVSSDKLYLKGVDVTDALTVSAQELQPLLDEMQEMLDAAEEAADDAEAATNGWVFDTRADAEAWAGVDPMPATVFLRGDAALDDGRGGQFVQSATSEDVLFLAGVPYGRRSDVGQDRLNDELLSVATRPENHLKYRKRVVKNLPIRFPDYDALVADYAATYLLPQAFTIDWQAKQIFVLYGAETPTIRAEWFAVWSFTDMADDDSYGYVGCFGVRNYSATAFSEGLEVLYEGGQRFLYASNTDLSISKFNITSLPANKGLLQTGDALWSRNVGLHSQFSYRNGKWLVQQLGPTVGSRLRRHNFAVYNSDLTTRLGTVLFPLEDVGPWTSDATYADAIPKVQTMHTGDGFYFASMGGFHGTGAAIPYSYQGLKLFGSDGRLIEENLIDPEALRHLLNDLGYPAYKIEYEGAHQAPDGKIYSLCMTVSPLNTGDSYTTGILIFEEYARGEGSIDFSSAARVYPKPDITRYSAGIWPRSPDQQMHNPVTGERLTTWEQILDMMAGLEIPRFSYYTSAVTGVTGVGGETLPGGTLVTFTSADNVTFKALLQGFGFSREYTVYGTSGSRSIRRRQFQLNALTGVTAAEAQATGGWTHQHGNHGSYLQVADLTAAGRINLSGGDAVSGGDVVRIKRGAGAFTLSIRNSAGTEIAILGAGEKAEFVRGATDWGVW